jgi:hypothetical protein
VNIVVGTVGGLFEVGDDGKCEQLSESPAAVMSGPWVVSDGSIDGLALPAPAYCVQDVDGVPLVGTAGARLFLGDDPVESFDAIPSRDEWYTPWGAPPDTRSLAASPEAGWLVNVHVGGVWHSPDAGGSWAEVVEVEADTHQVLARGSDVVAAAAVGFGHSADGGASWTWTEAGLHGSYSRAVALCGDTVLLTASTGPFSKEGAVYRRPLASDAPFSKCSTGLPEWFDGNIDTFQLVADDRVAVFGTDAGTVYASDDQGATWDVVASGLPPVRCIDLRQA